MNIIEWLRVIFLGIVEGITEWLPVSSTGHLILVDAFWKTSAPEVFTAEFTEMFDVVIQLGAILAVVTVFFYKPIHQVFINKIIEQYTNHTSRDTANNYLLPQFDSIVLLLFCLAPIDWQIENRM